MAVVYRGIEARRSGHRRRGLASVDATFRLADDARVQGQALFEHVVQLTEVSSVLAPGLVRRALVDGRADPSTAMPLDYVDALPRIRARLKAYVSEEEASRRIGKIEAFLEGLAKKRAPVPVDFGAFADPQADFTTQGRRWTADELVQLRAARERKSDPGHGEGE